MKLCFAALLAAWLALPLACRAGLAESHFDTAQKMKAQGRLIDARAEMEVAAQLEPGNAEYQKALADLGGDTAPAAAAPAPNALTASAGSAKTDGLLAEASRDYRESRLKEAAEAWQRVLELDPSNAAASDGSKELEREKYKADPNQPYDGTLAGLFEAAWKEIRRDHFVEARAKIEEGLRLNSSQAQFAALLAEVGNRADRQRDLEAGEGYRREGEALLAAGKLAEAREKLAEAMKMNIGDTRAAQAMDVLAKKAGPEALVFRVKGEKALKAGQWEKARKEFMKCLALVPADPVAQEELAQTEAKLKKSGLDAEAREQAKKDYNRGLETLGAGDYATAEKRFQAALNADPNDAEAAQGLEQARTKLKEQAGKWAKQVADWQAEAARLEDKGALEAALELHKKVLFKDPGNVVSSKAVERLGKGMVK